MNDLVGPYKNGWLDEAKVAGSGVTGAILKAPTPYNFSKQPTTCRNTFLTSLLPPPDNEKLFSVS